MIRKDRVFWLKNPLFLLILALFIASAPRFKTFNTDTDFAALFIEEKCSGYAGRTAALGQGWDFGGGWTRISAYMPASTILTYISFKTLGLGQSQFRLPYFLAALLGLWLLAFASYRFYGLVPALFAIMAFGSAPFLLSLYGSTLNEILYFFYFGLLYCLLSQLKIHSKLYLYLTGLLCSFVLFIKLDGITVLPAMALLLTIELNRKKCSKKVVKCAFFCIGIVTGIGLLILYYYFTVGLTAAFHFFFDTFVKGVYHPRYDSIQPVHSIADFLYKTVVTYSKNAYIFNPWFFFCALMGLFYFPFRWRQLDIGARFSGILILIHIPFLLIVSLFTYYKRFIVILPAFYFLGLNLIHSLRRHPVYESKSEKIYLPIIAAVVFAVTLLSIFSYFSGYWNPAIFNNTTVRSDILISIIVGGSALTGIILAYIKSAKRLLYFIYISLAIFSATTGFAYYSSHHHRQLSHVISQEIAKTVSDGSVVAEAPALRFFAYDSTNKIAFVSENDPQYPKRVFELILNTSPDYVVLAKSHFRFFSRSMAIYFKNYQLIKKIEYEMPEYGFETTDGKFEDFLSHHTISIYKKVGHNTS